LADLYFYPLTQFLLFADQPLVGQL